MRKLVPASHKLSPEPEPSAFRRYGVAAVAVLGAAGLRLVLAPVLGKAPFLAFLLAVMVAGGFGGLGAGLAATGLGSAACWYIFLDPPFSFEIPELFDFIRLVLFAAIGVGISILCGQLRQSRSSAAQSEQALRALIESAALAIVTATPDGKISLVNAAAERLFGYQRQELLGEHLNLLVPEQYRERHQAHLAAHSDRPLNRSMGVGMELSARRKDGSEFPVEVALSSVQTDLGLFNVAFVTDITERRRAEQALRRYELLADYSRDIILFTRRDNGRILEANAAATIYGYSREELLTLTVRELRAPSHQGLIASQMEEADTRSILFETLHRRKDGSTFPVEVGAQGATMNGTRALISIVRDITARKQAQEALGESQTRLRVALEAAELGTWELDFATGVVTATARTCAVFGFDTNPRPLAEWLGRIHAEDREGVKGSLERAAAGGGGYEAEFRVISPDGSIRWILSKGAFIPEGEGRAARMVGVTKDITRRKRAEQALRESQADLNRAQAVARTGSWRLDVRRNELTWSDETHRMFGVPKGTRLTYETFVACVHPDDREALDRAWQDALRGGRYDFEHRIIVAGALNWVRERAELEFDAQGALQGGFGTVQEITEIKRADEEIHNLNAELEQRVRHRTAQLEAANKELEAFAYSVSHDLRAPLRGIDGWSMALLEDYGGQFDERGRQYLERVRSETQHMGLLIENLLQLSRVTRTEMTSHAIELTALAENIAGKLREANPDRGVEFVIQPLMTASGDARLLEVALTNLLGNALKFTTPRALARIEFGQTERDGESAFYVRDNGVGFDMAYAGTLFHAFNRLHKASEFPGTGIGLATVQRVIQRHGGRVWAEAEAGNGATFYFTIGSTK